MTACGAERPFGIRRISRQIVIKQTIEEDIVWIRLDVVKGKEALPRHFLA